MLEAKPVYILLASHFCLSSHLCTKTQEDQDYMKDISYTSIVGSTLYAMISIDLDITHTMGVVRIFTSNPGGPC